MPRAERILGNGITYHVVANCNGRGFLFKEDADFDAFLKHLEQCQKNWAFDLHGYSLLHSHIHLILTTHDNIFLDKVMYEICQRFAFRHNRENNQQGHFWKNRYFSKVILDDIYAIICLRYLHRNSIKAGLVQEAARWRWSCAKHYLAGDFPSMLTPLPSYMGLAEDMETRSKLYRRWLETPLISDEIEKHLMQSKIHTGSRRFQASMHTIIQPILSELTSK